MSVHSSTHDGPLRLILGRLSHNGAAHAGFFPQGEVAAQLETALQGVPAHGAVGVPQPPMRPAAGAAGAAWDAAPMRAVEQEEQGDDATAAEVDP